MKFNEKKWEWILNHRSELHQKAMTINDEQNEQRRGYSDIESHYVRSWNALNKDQYEVIKKDKKLSSSHLQRRIQDLKNNWPSVCSGFGLPEEYLGRHQLLKVYNEMLSLKKLTERYEEAIQQWRDFSACFSVLKEFASQHTKVSTVVHNAVEDTSSAMGY